MPSLRGVQMTDTLKAVFLTEGVVGTVMGHATPRRQVPLLMELLSDVARNHRGG